MHKSFKLPEETSIFLDAVRVVAAFMVFVSHYGSQHYSGGFLWQLEPLGSRAVDVFFVLSGFLIANSVANRPYDIRRYAIARMSRIYSVAVPALFVTLASYWITVELGRPHMTFPEHGWREISTSMALNLVFLGRLWNADHSFLSDGPYWSLNFEVIYYAIFGLALLRTRFGLFAAMCVSLLAGPKILVLMPVWLLGALIERIAASDRISPRFGLAICAAVLAASTAWWRFGVIIHGSPFAPFDMTMPRLLVVRDSYITGLLFAALVLGFHGARNWFAAPMRRIAKPVRWLAGMSFAFYLFHMPLMDTVEAVLPWPADAWPTRALVPILAPLAVWPLALISEHRKGAWARFFDGVLPARAVRPQPAPSP
jgi:peptidoglycan/LPS O-acetylase OafA/YrhL